ncbi:hypothetical protein MIMGU_mgv1a014308mg [Erythranthe guttata]|uniref:Uncharacterized protein n=1 Tax=Erythranthe guttata TaxID=4155 RepID=A0A022RBU0_ERYGU|nr:hypothetical protein MIMGU_mgv1a014308mg [Erythranthe guttata]
MFSPITRNLLLLREALRRFLPPFVTLFRETMNRYRSWSLSAETSLIELPLRNPPLIQKSENQIADYCVTLDGDDSYSCWEAYFELKDLEKEAPKEEVEKLIMEAGGVKSLIGCVHGVAAIHKEKKESTDSLKLTKIENTRAENPRPVPDGLPKTSEELEEEENAKMPDSPFTRLLRARGTHPAWYSQAPEHETD